MAANERIEDLISKEALESFDQLNAKVALSVTGIEKLIAAGVKLNGGLGGGGFKKFNDDTKALTDNEKALEQQAKQLETAQAKLNATFTANAEKLAQAKVVTTEVNKQMRDQARDALGLTDAYDKLTKEYNEAAKLAKNLAVQYGAQSKQAQEASKRALELDQRLKAADANVGRFNKNVGNYSGAVKIMEKSLVDVKKKLDDFGKSGNQNADVIAQLRKEEQLLNGLLTTQVNGFLTATAEVRENTKALQQLESAGLKGTAAYTSLFDATAALKDETSDLKKALTNAAPDDVAFNAAADAAKGLIGVYGLGKSIGAAFGLENEALEETFVKLQAAETALQSIEAIRQVFKKENAVRQAITIGLQKIEILQTNLQTGAESKNIVVKYAAIAAQKTLNFVTSAAGGPLIALIGGLTLLVVLLSSFASASGKAALNFDKLNAEFDEGKRVLDDYIDSVKRDGDETVAVLESQFASEDKIRKQRVQNLRDQLKATIETESARRDQAKQSEEFLRSLAKKSLTDDLSKKELEQVEKAQEFVDKQKGLAKQRADLASQIRVDIIGNEKETTEESIKARQDNLDAEKAQLQLSASAQQALVSNERKTFEERIAALKKFGSIQEQLINNDATKQRISPGQTPTQLALIEKNRSTAIIQARRDSAKQIEDLTRSFNEREQAAQLAIIQSDIQTNAEKNSRIADDDKKGFTDRLDANVKYFQLQKSLIVGQKNFDLKNQTLTAKEKQAIEQKSNDALILLQIDFIKKVRDLENAQLETSIQHTLDGTNKRRDILLAQVARDRADGILSEEDYQNKILEVQFDAAQNEIKILINAAKKKLEVRRAAGEDTSGLLAQLAAYERQLEEDGLSHTEEVEEKKFQIRLSRIQKIGQISNNIFSAISELQNIQFDTEKVQVEEAIAAIEKKNEAEIAAINASSLSEQEKANKIQILNATAAAQKEAQERRLKQIEADKAKFERVVTIQRIIADTAAAVVAALGSKPFTPLNIALAASVGVLGAAQLARVIATPLPKFEHGTMDAPGGLSLVSEKRRELVVTPEGKMIETPSIPTIMNIPKHSIVFPDSRKMLESGLAVNRRGVLIQNNKTDDGGVVREIRKLATVIKNKKETNISADERGLTAIWKYGANWISYVEDNINF